MERKIFIVEDHPHMRTGIKMLLEMEEGLAVCGEAANGAEALERLASAAPDLVLVDISMPGMSGIELTEHLRQEHPDLAVIMLSGHEEALYGEAAQKAGADAYIDKFSGPDPLLEAIRRVLGSRGRNGQPAGEA